VTNHIEPSSQVLPKGAAFKSEGGRFGYRVVGPICRLYDREELPWPSCSLQWHGKQPSWNRIGPRLVPDMAAARCPSYQVEGVDAYGNTWQMPMTLYSEKLTKAMKHWWITKKPQAASYPEAPGTAFQISSEDFLA